VASRRHLLSVTRVTVVAATSIAVLLVLGIGALVLSADRFDVARSGASHGRRIQDEIDNTLESVLDVETGVRAYLLTGGRDVLAPYREGQALFHTSIQAMGADLAGDVHQGRARRIAAGVRAYFARYVRPAIALRAAGPLRRDHVRRLIALGKRQVDALRAQLAGLERVEQIEDTHAIAAAARAGRGDREVGVAALAVAMALVLLVGELLRRGILHPLRRLRRVAESLSEGDLSIRLGASPSREFAPINQAIDVMATRLVERRQELVDDLEDARLEVLYRLARACEYRDDDTHEHTERVASLAALLARRMGAGADEVATLRLAAILHDIGKIGVSDLILLKPGKLTDDEFAEMQRHTTFGAEMLTGSASPVLRMAERIALGHHERWDGKGYPMGLRGAATSQWARIVAVADVFDALTHERPYKPAWPVDRARAEIASNAGAQFDPDVVAAFLSLSPDELQRAAERPVELGGALARPALA